MYINKIGSEIQFTANKGLPQWVCNSFYTVFIF